MKKLILILMALVVGVCWAEDIDQLPPFTFSVPTNGATITTNTYPLAIDGSVEAVFFEIGGASLITTVSVDVATVADLGTGPSRTILNTNTTASAEWYPRVQLNTKRSAAISFYDKFPLSQDKVRCAVWGGDKTGITAKVWILLSH